jgi:protein gp37
MLKLKALYQPQGKAGRTTDIPYLDATWEPVVGCSPASPGCAHCYARKYAHRFACNPRFGKLREVYRRVERWDGTVELVQSRVEQPLHLRKSRRIGVCFKSDLFHENVKGEWLEAVNSVMANCPQHTFYVLTKRADAMLRYYEGQMDVFRWRASKPGWKYPLPNVLLGATAENQARLDERIGPLLQLAGQGWRTWLSLEPLLGEVHIRPAIPKGTAAGVCAVCGWGESKFHHNRTEANGKLYCPDCRAGFLSFVVVGCESGPGARPCELTWVKSIVDQCQKANVPVYVKQLRVNGKLLRDCKSPDWPEWAVRQIPMEVPK